MLIHTIVGISNQTITRPPSTIVILKYLFLWLLVMDAQLQLSPKKQPLKKLLGPITQPVFRQKLKGDLRVGL